MQSVAKICTFSIFQLYHPFDIFLYLFDPLKKMYVLDFSDEYRNKLRKGIGPKDI